MRTSVILGALLAAALLRAGPEYPNRGPDIYDVKADGFALIQTARQQARPETKECCSISARTGVRGATPSTVFSPPTTASATALPPTTWW